MIVWIHSPYIRECYKELYNWLKSSNLPSKVKDKIEFFKTNEMQLQNSGKNNDICRHFVVIYSKLGLIEGWE